CREIREVEAAPEVAREDRAEAWGRWLAERRYRSQAELARAAGVSRETVSAALRGSHVDQRNKRK
ncbi:MAG: helix-turn-helix domain-containing protein, partial [Dehalococcoidia bacterium]|nr:helix-turn-helix domain-containing protein [Dehalococcoidia bacterium]